MGDTAGMNEDRVDPKVEEILARNEECLQRLRDKVLELENTLHQLQLLREESSSTRRLPSSGALGS
jgi:hypothetical protein